VENKTGAGRRGSGEDSIYKDGERWRGAVSLGATGDGRRRRIKVSGRTKAEVVAKLKQLHRSLDAGIEQPTRRLTIGAFLDAWLAGLPARVEPSTVTNYTDMVKTHLKPALGAKLLSQLTVSDVNALWATKRKAGYKPNSIRIMRAVLRAALRQAERESLVIRNVAALSDAPRVGQSEGRSHHRRSEASSGRRFGRPPRSALRPDPHPGTATRRSARAVLGRRGPRRSHNAATTPDRPCPA
jgi:integrase